MNQAENKFHSLVTMFACVLCIVVLSPLLKAPLLFDDASIIAKDSYVAAVRRGDASSASLFQDIWIQSRPIRLLSHRMDVALFGTKTAAPHAENIALHIAAGLLFASLLAAIGIPSSVQLVALALFLIHPACVESVGVLSHRKELLSALFLLAALRVSLEQKASIRAIGVPFLFLAVFSKETAFVFPILWLLFARASFQNNDPAFRNVRQILFHWAIWMVFTGFFAMLAWFQIRHGMTVLHADPALDPNRAGHYGAGAPWGLVCSAVLRAFPRFLAGFIIPWGHSIDPEFHLHVPLLSARTFAAAWIWVFYGSALVVLWRRKSRFFSPLAWMVISLSPYLFPPLLRAGGTAAFCDRYAYLASFGFAWFLSEAIHALASRTRRRGPLIWILTVVFMVVYSGFSAEESLAYRSKAKFWRRAVRWNPGSYQALYNYAHALWRENGDKEGARTHFERMRALCPSFAFGMSGYADFLASIQDRAAVDVLEEGLRHAQGSRLLIRSKPGILLRLGLFSEALEACRKAESCGVDGPSFQFVFAESCRLNNLWQEAFLRYHRAFSGENAEKTALDAEAIFAGDPVAAFDACGIAVAGDSVPHGTDAAGGGRPGAPLSERIAIRLGGIPSLDVSEPGSLSKNVADVLFERKADTTFSPRWFVIMTGHNDAFFGMPANEILSRIASCIWQARRMGMCVLVVGPIPVVDGIDRNRARQETILSELDGLLSAFCRSNGIFFLSARKGLSEGAEPKGGWLVSKTGNHLVEAGLDRIADLCASQIRSAEETLKERRRKTAASPNH